MSVKINKKLSVKSSILLISLLSVNTWAKDPLVREVREPEAATGYEQKQGVIGSEYMVAAANPYASEAGKNILARGGSAIDAAIAVQLVLTLVEPQSSGIGGGAFILHFDGKQKALTTFDGRETAPQSATPDLFIGKDGKPVRWIEAVVGGRSVGVPGVLAALKQAHEQHGKLPWNALFDDAISLADNGFVVSPRLAKLVEMKFNPGITQLPEISNYFFPNGEVIKAGDILVNKALAKVFKSLAKEGTDAFYHGWIARDIVNKVQNAAIEPGRLTLKDMQQYKPIEQPAVCGPYRQFKVCGMAPPGSGGIAVVQMLALLESFEMEKLDPNSLEAVHLFTQSSRLAFADRDKYVADPAFVTMPIDGLLAPKYIKDRAQLISREKDMGKAQAGEPKGAFAFANNDSFELPSTSHIVVVDADGNAISMTSSIEMAFGSALMVNGFILNNQLTDFALSPKRDGKWVANRVEGNKRPRSSMAPMMVFNNDGSFKLAIGSPGGSRIINYVAQSMIGILDWQLTPQEAINLPRVTNRNKLTTLEQGTEVEGLKSALEKMGHKVMVRSLNSGIQAIAVENNKLVGGADPRREGKVFAK